MFELEVYPPCKTQGLEENLQDLQSTRTFCQRLPNNALYLASRNNRATWHEAKGRGDVSEARTQVTYDTDESNEVGSELSEDGQKHCFSYRTPA